MEVEKVGQRGVLFTFDDLSDKFNCTTNVYAINGTKHIFICDTYLGPEAMKDVLAYINYHFDNKPLIIFNSHSDWDHVWGNCAFEECMIISHKLCREKILKKGSEELKKHSEFQLGKVSITPSNITFEESLTFHEDGIEFFYSPGHTVDSASCFDSVDKVLYAGDNLELPTPVVQWSNLQMYSTTLESYLKMDVVSIVTGHCAVSDKSIVLENLGYIYNLILNSKDS